MLRSLLHARVVTLPLLAMIFASVAWSAPVSEAGSMATAGAVQGAIRFRTSFGLVDRPALVAATFGDSMYTSEDWGVPLSAVELQDLDRRSARVLAALPGIEAASKLPGFAGAYFDQERGATPVVLTSGGLGNARSAISSAVGSSDDFEVQQVARSLAELERLQERVIARVDELERQGIDLLRINYRFRSNKIEVVVESGGANVRARAASIVDAPDGIEVVEGVQPVADACVNYADCPNAKGGIKILGNSSIPVCTAGFMAKRTDVSPDALVLLTAGHCQVWSQTNGNLTWWHDSVRTSSSPVVGTQNFGRVWSTDPDDQPIPADVGLIKLASGFVPTNKNLLLTQKNYSSSSLGSVAAMSNANWPGIAVCSTGAGSAAKGGDWPAKRCGQTLAVTAYNKTCKGSGQGSGAEPCARLSMTVEVSYDSTGGDSGGPYWLGPQSSDSPWVAIGMHTHSDPDEDLPTDGIGWYVPLNTQLHALGQRGWTVKLCVNSDCD